MPSCAVRRCKNSSGSVKMNSFPKNPERRNLWAKNAGVIPSQYSMLCEVFTLALCYHKKFRTQFYNSYELNIFSLKSTILFLVQFCTRNVGKRKG